MTTFNSLDELRAAVGTDLGSAGPIAIPQSMIEAFADVTMDHQWIHVDHEKAKNSSFGATIAHGYLTLSLASAFMEKLLTVENVSAMLNYGLDFVRFPAPVLSETEVSATAVLSDITDKPDGAEVKVKMTMTTPTSTKPACVATIVLRIVR